VNSLLDRLRSAWATQVRLQQRRIDGSALTGREAMTAGRRLRWSGPRLLGDLLPD
jgi:hypothetical protein